MVACGWLSEMPVESNHSTTFPGSSMHAPFRGQNLPEFFRDGQPRESETVRCASAQPSNPAAAFRPARTKAGSAKLKTRRKPSPQMTSAIPPPTQNLCLRITRPPPPAPPPNRPPGSAPALCANWRGDATPIPPTPTRSRCRGPPFPTPAIVPEDFLTLRLPFLIQAHRRRQAARLCVRGATQK